MINAHVEMNLDDYIAVSAACILEILKHEKNEIIMETLMSLFLKKNKKYMPSQFIDSITLLYMLDFIEISNYKVVIKNV